MAALNQSYPSTAAFVWTNTPIELTFHSTLDWPTYQQIVGPLAFEVVSVSWQMERAAYDRMHLAALVGALAPPPRVLRALVGDRCPRLVRRAPRPAGRPYGWRRARKGGRRT